jgi:hypothetical protein
VPFIIHGHFLAYVSLFGMQEVEEKEEQEEESDSFDIAI